MEKKEYIRILRKKRLEIVGKNLFLLALSNIMFISSLKMFNLGFPYYKDSKKKYSVSVIRKNNYGDSLIDERYVFRKDLNIYKQKTNKLYLKDEYEFEDNLYKRNVKVYQLNKNEDFDEVINNYLEYINDDVIDEFTEFSNCVDNKYLKGPEVVVKYYDINKGKYREVYESDKKNIICSVVYSSFSLIIVVLLVFDSLEKNSYINYEIKELKRKKDDM